jgi:pantoate--beta-alanine ligase
MTPFYTPADLRTFTAALRAAGKKIALVPTMGALHAGHASLMQTAREHADMVVVSIFVNPTQFGPNEDFAAYPRQVEKDIALCEAQGVAAVYLPTVEAMYPTGHASSVRVAGLTEHFDGAARPGHFDGVATIVTKLLLQALPDSAFFGEKDYQQLQVIRRMVQDLAIPVQIIGVPTLREADGLALSSRNAYLTAGERAIAPVLYQTLCWVREVLPQQPIEAVLAQAQARLLDVGFASVDYLALADLDTLAPTKTLPARLLVAARLGRARLIDNVLCGS